MNAHSFHSTESLFEALGRMMAYPEEISLHQLKEGLTEWRKSFPQTTNQIEQFLRQIPASLDELEEAYTRTFEVTPACVPYVSIHLFGEENFKRGAFMAELQRRYQEVAFDPGAELVDHLGVLLRFANRIASEEFRELSRYCLLGPLGKMLSGIALENSYRPLLCAIHSALQETFPNLEAALSPLEQMQTHSCGSSSAETASPTPCSEMGCGMAAPVSFSRTDSSSLIPHPNHD